MPCKFFIYKDLQKPDAPVVELLNKQDASYDFLGCEGNTFWFRTDLAAPRGMGPGDATRRQTVVGTYEKAQSTGAQKSSEQSATLSDVGGGGSGH